MEKIRIAGSLDYAGHVGSEHALITGANASAQGMIQIGKDDEGTTDAFFGLQAGLYGSENMQGGRGAFGVFGGVQRSAYTDFPMIFSAETGYSFGPKAIGLRGMKTLLGWGLGVAEFNVHVKLGVLWSPELRGPGSAQFVGQMGLTYPIFF